MSLMKRAVNKCLRLLSLNQLQLPITETPDTIRIKRAEKWFQDEGDKTHRLNYVLDSNSLVFDLGGYEGQWASDIYAMYNCTIWVFEPSLPFAKKIEKRFEKNSKIRVFSVALGARDEVVGFSAIDNSSSIFLSGPKNESIKIVDVVDFLKTNKIQSIDLIKINIEGAEYELLEKLIDKGLINIFKNIQVQFHDFIIQNAPERMKNIQDSLSLTHNRTYHYEFIWENWELKE